MSLLEVHEEIRGWACSMCMGTCAVLFVFIFLAVWSLDIEGGESTVAQP